MDDLQRHTDNISAILKILRVTNKDKPDEVLVARAIEKEKEVQDIFDAYNEEEF